MGIHVRQLTLEE